jgi:ribose-phosphate pyrophosphokinase
MNFSDPSNLAILACPGGEHFASEVVRRLRGIYRKRLEKRAIVLSKRYGIEREEAVRRINFANDSASPSMGSPRDVTRFRIPKFKVDASFTCFANGELKTEIHDSVRGKDLYIFQDVENSLPLKFNDGATERVLSVNDHIFNLMVTVDASLQAGAKSVTLVLPVYPYSRQHKKKGREGLTASRFGQIMENFGVKRIITLDIHSREIENCFNKTRLENLHASYQIIRELSHLVDLREDNLVVVSPDTGAVDRNKFYSTSLQRPLALLYKERDYSKVSQSAINSNITQIRLLGDVQGKNVFMADDMLGTGGTMIKAMRALKDFGAERIVCAVSLPFFSGSAIEDFDAAYAEGLFYRIIGTNAVSHDKLLTREWYRSTNVCNLFAAVIAQLHHNRSLSSLLDNRSIIQRLLER